MKRLFILMISVLFIVGCNQDPLSEAPARIRDGFPPNQKAGEDRMPIDKDMILIKLHPSSNPNFVEGYEKTIEFDIRILTKDPVEYKFYAENLPEGATFDADNKTFTWKPADNYVSSEANYKVHKIRVGIITLNGLVQEEIDFALYVNRLLERPEISNFELLNDKLIEGDRARFSFTIDDKDSSINAVPKVSVVGPSNSSYKSAGHFIKIGRVTQDANVPTRWHVSGTIETFRLELENSYDNFGFGLQVFSKFGVNSDTLFTVFKVYHKVQAPFVTIDGSKFTVVRGKENLSLSFAAIASHSADRVKLSWKTECDKLEGFVKCQCRSPYPNRSVECHVTISPGATTNQYNFEFQTVTSNTSDSKISITKNHEFKVKVNDPVVVGP